VIYDIRQTTTYTYGAPVSYAHHVLHLMPINRVRQRVHAAVLDVLPVPVERREGFDFFGNRLTWIGLEEPHDSLTIKVAARIAVEPLAEAAPPATPAWEAEREAVSMTADLGHEAPAHFLFPSPLIPLDSEISDYARASFPAGRPVLVGATDLMARIRNDFTYDVSATTVTTTPAAAFELRRGVCQDFAHVMISGLRGIGLPAAYVSGYLRTVPRPGQPRLEGADAMHAWVLVWCGEAVGWRGLDPTNAIPAGEDHITLAIGRDYSDIAPVAGVVFASGEQRIAVAVDVVPVAEAASDEVTGSG
jgi:transglutaminase-like putative cysteine protease